MSIRRILEEKGMYKTGTFGRFFSPTGHNFARQSFETQDGWMLSRKKNGSFRVVNDPLGIFVGLVGSKKSTQTIVVGDAQGGTTTGTVEFGSEGVFV